MLQLAIFAAAAAVSFLTIWRGKRWRTSLSFALPPLFLVALGFGAFKFAERYATCQPSGSDCGPSMFFAIGLFAIAVSMSGFAGSIVGVVCAHLLLDRRKLRPALAAAAIGLAFVAADVLLFHLIAGGPFAVSIGYRASGWLFTSLPFLILAIAGRSGRLPWAVGIAVTSCLAAWDLFETAGLLDTAEGGRSTGIGPIASTLLIAMSVLAAALYRSGPAREA